MLRRCPQCGKQVPLEAEYCPACGARIAPIPVGPPIRTAFSRGLLREVVEAFTSLIIPVPTPAPSYAVWERMPAPAYYNLRFMIPLAIMMMASPWLLEGAIANALPLAIRLMIRFLGFFLAGLAGPLLFLMWIYLSDKYEREPFELVLLCFGWGAFSTFFAGLLNSRVVGPVMKTLTGNEALSGAVVEEPLKILGVYIVMSRTKFGKELNTHLDGMIYGFAAGMGFAALENFSYLLISWLKGVKSGDVMTLLDLINFQLAYRVFIYGMNHGIYTAMSGRWMGLGRIRRGYVEARDLIPGLAVAMFLHGLWNHVDFIIPLNTLEEMLAVYTTLALIYAAFFLKLLREGLRDERVWYAMAPPPIEGKLR